MSLSGRLTRSVVRGLDALAAKVLPPEPVPPHQVTGRRGEEDAYFYLRRLGYVMVARNFRSPLRRSELDLIGWDGNVLCFIEVKTRTSREVKPAEAAVDQEKRRDLMYVARDYMRHLRTQPPWRFDIVSVYYENRSRDPVFELFRGAIPSS
ncbi:MAG TPA: YraN family protein [Terriglobales bacterium]